MKIAIIGSRGIGEVDLTKYLPKGITLVVSGGAVGVDALAEKYADNNKIPKLIFLPDYQAFGRVAPLIRNKQIVDGADCVVAFWDGKSRGTKYTIDYAESQNKPVKVFLIK